MTAAERIKRPPVKPGHDDPEPAKSIAEACALAAAGPNARLVVARRATHLATCALAQS